MEPERRAGGDAMTVAESYRLAARALRTPEQSPCTNDNRASNACDLAADVLEPSDEFVIAVSQALRRDLSHSYHDQARTVLATLAARLTEGKP